MVFMRKQMEAKTGRTYQLWKVWSPEGYFTCRVTGRKYNLVKTFN